MDARRRVRAAAPARATRSAAPVTKMIDLRLALLVVAACSSSAPAPTPPVPLRPAVPPPARIPGPDEPLATDGMACMRNEHCASGVCEGEGCFAQGVCVPKDRACTKDLREYCGCDQVVFHASGTCPGRTYSGPGACPSTYKPDGASCLSAAECASQMCEGEGCGPERPGRCTSTMRTCTADDVELCDCDGRTRHGTSSCPGMRYSHRGTCTQN